MHQINLPLLWDPGLMQDQALHDDWISVLVQNTPIGYWLVVWTPGDLGKTSTSLEPSPPYCHSLKLTERERIRSLTGP